MSSTAGECAEPTWAVASSIATNYERRLVPLLFDSWARILVDAVAPTSAERVLDVACGTGIVARTVAARLGPSASITGIDINGDMLALARQLAPEMEWLQADATDTGFPVAAFDVVFCQQGLQFVADPAAALREWRRILVPGGRLALSAWHNPDNPGYAAIRSALRRCLPEHPEAVGFVRAIFGLSNPTQIHELLLGEGFHNVRIAIHADVVKCPTPQTWIEAFLSAAPVRAIAELGHEEREHIVADAVHELREYIADDGSLFFPISTNIATADA